MRLGADGHLSGTPERPGRHEFRIEVVHEHEHERPHEYQAYTLRVAPLARPSARAASAPAPAASPVLNGLGPEEAARTIDRSPETPVSYLMTSEDFQSWLESMAVAAAPTTVAAAPEAVGVPAPSSGPEPPEGAASNTAPAITDIADAGPMLPTVEQLTAQLTPLLQVEFPTRPLFEKAMQDGRCEYFRSHVREQAEKRGLSSDLTCPPRPATAPVPRGQMSLSRFYDALLPADLQSQLIALAERRHPIEDATPMRLASMPCGCHAVHENDTVYGLMPFWLATETPQVVDFGLFGRIGLMGALLKDDGTLSAPAGWDGQGDGFAREMQRHGANLDMVIYRRDWSALLDLPPAKLESFIRTAARNAVLMTEARFQDAQASWLDPLLIPAWREPPYLYSGLTIFFDDATVEPSKQAVFKKFYRQFMQHVIAEMAAIGRSYHLSLVVPDVKLGDEDSAYGFDQLADYMESAQMRPHDLNADLSTRQRYRGTTDITVHYLVTLGGQAGPSRRFVRRRIDETPILIGYRRSSFLQGVIPVQFGVRSDEPRTMAPDAVQTMSDGLAYTRWSFGGAAVWPLAVEGMGHGTITREVLVSSFEPGRGQGIDLCQYACPLRVPLRLLLQTTLMIDLLATFAYAWSCGLRRALGSRLLLLMWGAGLATLAAGCLFFSCDPLFEDLRASNAPLFALLLLLCLVGAVLTLRPRMEAP